MQSSSKGEKQAKPGWPSYLSCSNVNHREAAKKRRYSCGTEAKRLEYYQLSVQM